MSGTWAVYCPSALSLHDPLTQEAQSEIWRSAQLHLTRSTSRKAVLRAPVGPATPPWRIDRVLCHEVAGPPRCFSKPAVRSAGATRPAGMLERVRKRAVQTVC